MIPPSLLQYALIVTIESPTVFLGSHGRCWMICYYTETHLDQVLAALSVKGMDPDDADNGHAVVIYQTVAHHTVGQSHCSYDYVNYPE